MEVAPRWGAEGDRATDMADGGEGDEGAQGADGDEGAEGTKGADGTDVLLYILSYGQNTMGIGYSAIALYGFMGLWSKMLGEWTGLEWSGWTDTPLDCYDFQNTCGAYNICHFFGSSRNMSNHSDQSITTRGRNSFKSGETTTASVGRYMSQIYIDLDQ